MSGSKDQVTVQEAHPTRSSSSIPKDDSAVAVVQSPTAEDLAVPADQVDQEKKGFLAYFKTKEFYIVLVLGQVLAITNTSTSTLTTLLGNESWSIPTFQTLLNYLLLTLIFTPYTMYRYGLKGWLRLVWRDGWKCKFCLCHTPAMSSLALARNIHANQILMAIQTSFSRFAMWKAITSLCWLTIILQC